MEQQIIKDARKHFSLLGLMFFLGTLIVYGVQSGILVLAYNFFPDLMSQPDISLAVSSLSMYLVGMPLLILLVHAVPAVPVAKHNMKTSHLLITFCMCYALMYLSNLLGTFTTQIIGLLKGESVANPVVDLVSGISIWTSLFFMVLCAPIVEEFVFRKLIIDRISVRYGEAPAIVFSAFFFALFHGNLNQFVYAFTIGLLVGFIYAKTGRILYTILLHMGINFLGSIPGMLLLKSEFYQAFTTYADQPAVLFQVVLAHPFQMILTMLYLLFIMALVITGIVLLILNLKKFRCRYGMVGLPLRRLAPAMILNVGTILYLLFWALMILLQLIL